MHGRGLPGAGPAVASSRSRPWAAKSVKDQVEAGAAAAVASASGTSAAAGAASATAAAMFCSVALIAFTGDVHGSGEPT